MMNRNYKITIEYDGTSFFGWQRQKDKKTVQGVIERTLSRMLNQTVTISGSGRTDAGVHAVGQVASFHAETGILPKDIKKSLNSMIKDPIVIRDCHAVSDDFHAQFSAGSKEYHYMILNSENPSAVCRNFLWHIRRPLDLSAMNHCCKIITGKHDFKSFENAGSPRTSTIREVLHAGITLCGYQNFCFKIRATGFLKYMVRNLIGTIVLAGMGKLSIHDFEKILAAKDRTKAGPTAPPQGLFLYRVYY